VLLSPGVGAESGQASLEEHAGIVLGLDDLAWFRDCYFGSAVHQRNPYADPTAASDASGATVVTAGFDPLRDGGKAYADKLEADGVSVRYRNYEDMVHGFLTLRGVDRGEAAIEEVGGDLEEAFG
jgi:acetyl esterase